MSEQYTRCNICKEIVMRSRAMTPLPARAGGESAQVDAYLCERCKAGLATVLGTEQGVDR